MEKKLNMSKKKIAEIFPQIFGSGGAHHEVGLIDAESREFHACLGRIEEGWPKEFRNFFRRRYLQHFVTKLIWPIRRDIGLGRDLGTTNHIEALHRSYKTTIGKRSDVATVVARYIITVKAQETDMMDALLDRGRYKVRNERVPLLVIAPQDMNNGPVKRRKASLLFFCDAKTLNLASLKETDAQVSWKLVLHI